ncbi:MAG: AIR synthase-related protein [bacterium]|nr:AIR synthase-related protein [bacterium]
MNLPHERSAQVQRAKGAKGMYAEDGVNVEEESEFSKAAGAVCKKSYANSPFVEVLDLSEGQFRGPRPFRLKGLPDGYILEVSSDGLGTKGILIDAAKSYRTAGFDLFAMVASDITRYGGVPLVLTNVLDLVEVGTLIDEHNRAYRELLLGLGEAAKECRGVILKGETAQMGPAVGSDIPNSPTRFNWSANMFGAYHPDKMVTGNTVAAGDAVIALRERGFRCNGISSVRAAFRKKFGEKWWEHPDATEHLKEAAAPSVLYDVFVNTLHGWYTKNFTPEVELRAIVHISGGGIKEKLGNDVLFARGLSATLDNLFELPDIMRQCANWRGLGDAELYGAWNGGQGMLLIVPPKYADTVLARAKDFNIEAKIAGRITEEKTPRLVVHSKLSSEVVVYERA